MTGPRSTLAGRARRCRDARALDRPDGSAPAAESLWANNTGSPDLAAQPAAGIAKALRVRRRRSTLGRRARERERKQVDLVRQRERVPAGYPDRPQSRGLRRIADPEHLGAGGISAPARASDSRASLVAPGTSSPRRAGPAPEGGPINTDAAIAARQSLLSTRVTAAGAGRPRAPGRPPARWRRRRSTASLPGTRVVFLVASTGKAGTGLLPGLLADLTRAAARPQSPPGRHERGPPATAMKSPISCAGESSEAATIAAFARITSPSTAFRASGYSA